MQLHRGLISGAERDEVDSDVEERFMSSVPNMSDAHWTITLKGVLEAATRSTDAALGPDGMPNALYREYAWPPDLVWHVLEAVMHGRGDWRPTEFGLSVTAVICQATRLLVGIAGVVPVRRARSLACCHADCKVLAVSATPALSSACDRYVSRYQRGFVRGCALLAIVVF